MDRAGITSNRELARKLSTDASLISKWLGKGQSPVKRITGRRHILALAEILGTPVDYFDDPPASDRLQALEEEVFGLRRSGQALLEVVGILAEQVRELGGDVPDDVLRGPGLAALRRPRRAQRRSAR